MFCKTCGNKLDDDALFCMNCGVKVADDTSSKYCAHCGNELEAAAVFCMGCGRRIHISEAQPEVEKPAEIEEEGDFVESSEKNLTAEEKRLDSTANSEGSSAISNIVLIFLVVFLIPLVIFVCSSNSENRSTPVQNSSSGFAPTDTFNFDVLTPYTFKSNDGSYEYDCYSLSKGILSSLWNNPPRYFIYNNKKYEVDNKNIYYDDEDYDGDYNVIIYWGDYDGTYYHFLGVEIINGNKGMWLWKL